MKYQNILIQKLFFVLLFLSFIGNVSRVQAQALSLYQKEKIYIHTNHVFFKQGETLFFKLYLVDGSNQPNATSKIAYVEIIAPSGTVAEKQTYKIEDGYAEGSFAIQDQAVGGVYQLRAYTTWMMNETESTFFSKDFTVQKVISPRLFMKLDFPEKGYGPGSTVQADFSIRTLDNQPLGNSNGSFKVAVAGKQVERRTLTTDAAGKTKIVFDLPKNLQTTDALLTVTVAHDSFVESISRTIPITLNQIALQLMPEGGSFVAGIPTFVAFKAINEFGKAVDVKGVIVDDKGKTITNFESYKFGMGKFPLTPAFGVAYKAILTSPNGAKSEYALPTVVATGAALQLSKKDGKIAVQIFGNGISEVVLTGKSKEKVYYTQQLKLTKGPNLLKIDEKLFPAGIAQFTLSTTTGLPLAERILFLNEHQQLSVTITTDQANYQPREKVALTIVTKDENGTAIPSNFSLAVVDDKLWSFADDKQNHIFSWLLLCSELKGKIEEPQFYFKKDEPKAAAALDLLMLTQGYRYFDFIANVAQSAQLKFGFGENISVLGVVVDENDRPVSTDVFLVENKNKGKVRQLKTNNDGRFYFHSLDNAGDYLLLAKGIRRKKIKIKLVQSGLNYSFRPNDLQNLTKISTEGRNKPDEKQKTNTFPNLDWDSDDKTLNEVVVVTYGAQISKSLSSSVATVYRDNTNSINSGLMNAVQGRLPGIAISEVANPGATPVIQIRGMVALPVNSEPLFVIDGVAMGKEGISQLDVNDINSITVLKDAAAVAIYGSRAANGVVLINSKVNHNKTLKVDVTGKAQFEIEQVNVTGPAFTIVKKFYLPTYTAGATNDRIDFRETIYWNPVVQTDRNGTAKVEFYNSDANTTFRIIAEGIGYNGKLGTADTTYATTSNLQVDVKIPPYLTVGDKAELPMVLKNNGQTAMAANIAITLPKGLVTTDFETHITLPPKSAKRVLVPIVAESTVEGNIKFKITSNAENETLILPIVVQPKGFPVIATFAGNKNAEHQFEVSKMIKGTLLPKLSLYKDVEGQLLNGIESMLREPYGCFEQTSSTTYPNVFILKYLKQVGKSNAEIEAKALGYLKKGYQKLVGFETAEHGFEWFGKAPAHEALTAYGLLEFTAMKEFVDVDEAMLKRTKNFLLKRRDGKGGFQLASGGYDRFASVPNAIANVYIVYAMATAGFGNEIEPEYKAALANALKTNDAYQLALIALAADHLKLTADYAQVMTVLDKNYHQKDLGAETSLVNSRDVSLRVETMSLYALALMRAKNPDIPLIAQLISKILNQKSYYGYGSTQATVMALAAVVEYAKLSQQQMINKEIVLTINGAQVSENESLAKYFKEGSNTFAVRYKNGDVGIPYNLEVAYQTFTPPTAAKANLTMTTALDTKMTTIGETVRMAITVNNKENGLQAMSIAKIGIPAGLSLQPFQLKELIEQKKIAYYEIFDNYLVLYWMGFAAKETKNIALDLKAEVPGVYKSKASNVYLYYTPEHKYWNDGMEVVVR